MECESLGTEAMNNIEVRKKSFSILNDCFDLQNLFRGNEYPFIPCYFDDVIMKNKKGAGPKEDIMAWVCRIITSIWCVGGGG